jgi:hypothetical protein
LGISGYTTYIRENSKNSPINGGLKIMLSADRAKQRYQKRIMEYFQGAVELAKERGWTDPTIENMSDEEFAWGFGAYYKNKVIIIELILSEQSVTEGKGHGLTWQLIVNVNGEEIINYVPYNYSKELWANTLYELGIRFDMAIETVVDFITIEDRINTIEEKSQLCMNLE